MTESGALLSPARWAPPAAVHSRYNLEKSGMTWVGTLYDAGFEGTWAERDHDALTAPAMNRQ